MANGGNSRTKQDLLDEIDDLRAENEELQNALDAVYDIVAPSDERDERVFEKFAAIGVKLVCAENRRVVRHRLDR